ncbi:MAG: hypothetical protein GEU73_13360 [Chloroflexi bacterium]|nr:hypothetical protein [Chloroflexota bacterium]
MAIVLPSLEETLRRASQQEKQVKRELIREQHQLAHGWPTEVRLDTTGLTESESLALLLDRLRD